MRNLTSMFLEPDELVTLTGRTQNRAQARAPRGRKELLVNPMVSTPAVALIWEFFRYGQIIWRGAFVSLKTGTIRPISTPSGQEAAL